MRDVVYKSRVRVEMESTQTKVRRAHLPSEREPVLFGVHDEIAEHYGIKPDVAEPHAATIDYVVAGAAG